MDKSYLLRFVSMVLLLVTLSQACGSGTSASTVATPDSAATNSGITISSNKLISTYTTNMCTQYTGEACTFTGGQIVKFSDGSVMVTGQWKFFYVVSGDTDTNENTVTGFIPPATTSAYSTLSAFVAQGSGYRKVFLVYLRAADTVSLVYDSDNSLAYNASDTVITTLTVTDWP